jgi:hypothetical protein
MKKLTVLFVLLLSLSFTGISAQSKIRYEVSNGGELLIRVDGIQVVAITTNYETGSSIPFSINGEVVVAEGALVEVFAGSHNAQLIPIICEDDPYIIGTADTYEYNFIGDDHVYLEESFTMPGYNDMYISMKGSR